MRLGKIYTIPDGVTAVENLATDKLHKKKYGDDAQNALI